MKICVSDGNRTSDPCFPNQHLRPIGHGDRYFVAFKTLSESFMDNTWQYIYIWFWLWCCVFMQSTSTFVKEIQIFPDNLNSLFVLYYRVLLFPEFWNIHPPHSLSLYCIIRALNAAKHRSQCQGGLRHQVWKLLVPETYFHLGFFASFPFLTAQWNPYMTIHQFLILTTVPTKQYV